MAYYLDSSAAVKLIADESESVALIRWIAKDEAQLVSSDLIRTELARAAHRMHHEFALQAARLIDSLQIMKLRTEIFERAGELLPVSLRSLDALHLAAAMDLGSDLEGLITYDQRMAEAALAQEIVVVAPT